MSVCTEAYSLDELGAGDGYAKEQYACVLTVIRLDHFKFASHGPGPVKYSSE